MSLIQPQERKPMAPLNTTAAQPDFFWTAIDWAVRGAGALLLLILTVGWKDYRKNIKMINELHMFCRDFDKRTKQIDELVIQVAVLNTILENLKEFRHG
jgi:hypothetical protein